MDAGSLMMNSSKHISTKKFLWNFMIKSAILSP